MSESFMKKIGASVFFWFFLVIASPANAAKMQEQSTLLQKFNQVKTVMLKGYLLPPDYTSNYYARRIEPKLDRPDFASVANPQFLFRGMYLNPDQLEFILETGMAISQVKWTAAGGGISFSSNPNEAATYIFHSADQRSNGIGVVFKVKMSSQMKLVNDPVLNSTRTIYKKQSNVAASEIVDVYLWGQYGLESFDEILRKKAQGKIVPSGNWTGVFDRY